MTEDRTEALLYRLSKARDDKERWRKESVKWRARCQEQKKHIANLERKLSQ